MPLPLEAGGNSMEATEMLFLKAVLSSVSPTLPQSFDFRSKCLSVNLLRECPAHASISTVTLLAASNEV